MFNGRINEPQDWHHALRAVLNTPDMPDSVLTIMSDGLTGSIGIKHGRFITGAHASSGQTGVGALRQLMSITQGFCSYLRADQIQDKQLIDQGLQVDIAVLINVAPPATATPAPEAPPKPADEATAELRRTLQGMRPVSQHRIQAISPTPPPPPPPPPQPAFTYNPAAPADPSKKGSALDRVVSGAKTTYMKLASLSSRNKEQAAAHAVQQQQQQQPNHTPWPQEQQDQEFGEWPQPQKQIPQQQYQQPQQVLPPQQQVQPQLPQQQNQQPQQFGQWPQQPHGSMQPPQPPPQWPQPPQGAMYQGAPPERFVQQPDPQNIVQSVRATVTKIASRVAHAAKLKAQTEDRLEDNRKLRQFEGETAEQTETQKLKQKHWHKDPATIAMTLGGVLGTIAVIGGLFMAIEVSGGKSHIAAGKKYVQQGRNDLAVIQFTLAVDKNASDFEALQARAESYEELKDYDRAAADYLKLAELKPKVLTNARKAAYFQFKLNRYDQAAEFCKKILATNPDDESIKAQYAMNLARLGKFQEATEMGSRLDVELVPPYLVPDFFGSLAYAQTQLGDNRKAIDYYSRAIKADPSNIDVLAERASTYMSMRDYKKAIADFARVVKLNPGRTSAYVDLARACESANDYPAAVQAYENAVKLAPTADLYMHLAQNHFRTGKYGYVVSDCDAALVLDPRCFQAIKWRQVAMQKAKSGKAIVIAELSHEQVVRHASAKFTQTSANGARVYRDPMTDQGYAKLASGDTKGAINILIQVVKRSPQDISARRFLANAFNQCDRGREAFEQYNAIASAGSLLPSDELEYAKAAAMAGQDDRAIQLYLAVLDRDPNYVQARVNLIRLLVRKGYAKKASEVVAEGSKINPGSEKLLSDALGTPISK